MNIGPDALTPGAVDSTETVGTNISECPQGVPHWVVAPSAAAPTVSLPRGGPQEPSETGIWRAACSVTLLDP